MSNVPDGAQLSEDGYYWWDGENWQPIENADETESGGSESETGNDNAEVTAEDLMVANDNDVDPGDPNSIDNRYHTYFEPDYDGIDDDASDAESAEDLDDSQATGPSESNETEGEN